MAASTSVDYRSPFATANVNPRRCGVAPDVRVLVVEMHLLARRTGDQHAQGV
jgi:hypothetical protein